MNLLRENSDRHLRNGSFSQRKMEKSGSTVVVSGKTVATPPQNFTRYGKRLPRKRHTSVNELVMSQDSINVWVVGSKIYSMISSLCCPPKILMCAGNGKNDTGNYAGSKHFKGIRLEATSPDCEETREKSVYALPLLELS